MSVRLRDRLSYKHARSTVLVAFVLGLILSGAQIASDLAKERQSVDATVLEVLSTLREPASQAAYGLDESLALKVVTGLFEYRPIYHAEIYDDFGHRLASRTRPQVDGRLKWLATLFFGENKQFTMDLFVGRQTDRVGNIRVFVDTYIIASNFFDRSALILLGGVVRNVLLAILLTVIFYYSLTKPLLRLVASLRRIDPGNPGSEPVPVPDGHARDELGLMVAATNGLLLELGDSLRRRRAAEAKTAEREARLRGIMEMVADGIITLSETRIIESVNPSARRLTGYEEGALEGRDIRDLLPEPDRTQFLAALQNRVRDGGVADRADKPLELALRRRDGSRVSVSLSVSEMRRDGSRLFVCVLHDITERKRFEAQLMYMANHDPLTDLPNRTLLEDRLAQALVRAQRNRTMTAVLFLDLDRFKLVNDSLGHDVGDHLLRAVAERLQGAVRRSDTVGRLGGDEFMVVITDLAETHDAARISQSVLKALSQPFEIGERQLFITPSIGLSLSPNDGEDFQTLLRNADTAMYSAKSRGGNTYQFFTKAMNDTAVARLSIENSLREALAEDQFELYYQPKIDLASFAPVGLEALLRWRHPKRGFISPLHFVPVAEETGLIEPLGEWVLRATCRQLKIWEKQGLSGLPVAVNLSARQFTEGRVSDMVRRVLAETGTSPEMIEVEITETFMMSGVTHAIGLLNELRAMGIRIAIDDFGTGYSSLAYLKRLPITALKIDRSFVRDITDDPDDAAITNTIIAMGRNLGLKVVAEGVETEAQVTFLRRHGCDEIQGFYVAEPRPADEIPPLLAELPQLTG